NMRTAHYSYYTIFDRLRVYHYDDIDYETKKKTFLIHSKIYVIDNKVAYLGSLNFTYNGLVQSYESGIKIKDKDAIKKISKEIDLLFQGRINTNGKEMFFRDINEWGKSLYDEPNN
ncbi:NgoFVII family restriction endonuclease, partial [archaeon]|nr:NgoFVII family restriction endonuclease [archaeon]